MKRLLNIFIQPKTRAFKFVYGVLLAVLVSIPLNAQTDSDARLFNMALDAYEEAQKANENDNKWKSWLDAARYFTAYTERNPTPMQTDSKHNQQVKEALDYSIYRIDSLINGVKNVPGVTGAPPPPPPVDRISDATPIGHPIVCRGDGNIQFTYTASSDLSTKPQIWMAFKKASFGVGNDWRHIGDLAPGQCSWLDRGIGSNEPNRIVIKEPVLTPNRFAINWSQGGVTSIQSQIVASSVPTQSGLLPLPNAPGFQGGTQEVTDGNGNANSLDPVAAVSRLQSSDWLQAFDVYNDNKGNFIVMKVGRSSKVEMNVKEIAFQNGRSPSTSYTGTTDATLEQTIPDERTGNDPICFVDGDEEGTGQDRVAILRWDISAIPEGSTIIDASIALNVVNSSNDVYYLYEMKRGWVENQATWYDYRNGRQWANGGASGSQDRGTTRLGSLEALNSGKAEIHLYDAGIALVQSWVNNPANNRGVIIGNAEAGDGIDFNCSEASILANRPALTITYTEP